MGKLIGTMFMAFKEAPPNIESQISPPPAYVLDLCPMVIEIRSTPSLAALIEAMLDAARLKTRPHPLSHPVYAPLPLPYPF